jgi:hypothetical protein
MLGFDSIHLRKKCFLSKLLDDTFGKKYIETYPILFSITMNSSGSAAIGICTSLAGKGSRSPVSS